MDGSRLAHRHHCDRVPKGFSCVAQQCLDRQPPAGIFLYGTGLQFYRGSVLQDVGSSLDILSSRDNQCPRSSKSHDPGSFRSGSEKKGRGFQSAGDSLSRSYGKRFPFKPIGRYSRLTRGACLLSPKNSPRKLTLLETCHRACPLRLKSLCSLAVLTSPTRLA